MKDAGGNVNNILTLANSIHKDIRLARQVLNKMHDESCGRKAEIFMHSQTDDIIVVTRQFDFTMAWDAYVTISRCCYRASNWDSQCSQTIELPGTIYEICLAAYT